MTPTRYTGFGRFFLAWFILCSFMPSPALAQALTDPQGALPDEQHQDEPVTPEAPDAVAPEKKPDASPVGDSAEESGEKEEASTDAEQPSLLRRAPEPEPAAHVPPPVAAPPVAPPPTQESATEPAASSPERGDFMKRLLTPSPDKKEPDRFDLDYAPTKKKASGEKTPIYKHWLLWTLVGVAAFTGTILIIQYSVDHSDNLTLDVSRRTP